MPRTLEIAGLKIQVSDEIMNEAVDSQIQSIREAVNKENSISHEAASEFVKKLLPIALEYKKSVDSLNAIAALHHDYAAEKNLDKRHALLGNLSVVFKATMAQIRSHGQNKKLAIVPPLTDDLKNNIPKDLLPGIAALHEKLKLSQQFVQKMGTIIQSTQAKIAAEWKEQAEIRKAKENQGNPSAQVAAAPQASQPLPSMYDAKRQASLNQANAANRPIAANNPQTPNAKAK